MKHARQVHVQGFKSFADTGSVALKDGVNLLLGANGAGKSNFISFFKFLQRLCERQLYLYTGETGGASASLHKGAQRANELWAKITVSENSYSFRLRRTDDDRFIFVEERAIWNHNGYSCPLARAGADESELKNSKEPTARYTYEYLSGIRVFHFHDTSPDAPMMSSASTDNSAGLAGDAGNLASFLLHLRTDAAEVYAHICATIRLIAPFFGDFVLVPDKSGRVALRWRQQGLSEDTFGPTAFSDGTLRFICLATLLNQPEQNLPKLIMIDEPELGLHPHAIHILADMLKAAGARTQLLVATQSPFLVDHFQPENILVVQRDAEGSTLEQKSSEEFGTWLESYSLGELWRKNLLGGTPL